MPLFDEAEEEVWPYRRKRDTGGGWAFRVKRLTQFLVRFLCFMCEVQDASPRLPAPAATLRHQP